MFILIIKKVFNSPLQPTLAKKITFGLRGQGLAGAVLPSSNLFATLPQTLLDLCRLIGTALVYSVNGWSTLHLSRAGQLDQYSVGFHVTFQCPYLMQLAQ